MKGINRQSQFSNNSSFGQKENLYLALLISLIIIMISPGNFTSENKTEKNFFSCDKTSEHIIDLKSDLNGKKFYVPETYQLKKALISMDLIIVIISGLILALLYLAIFRNRKKSHGLIKGSEGYYKTILDKAADGIITIDKTGLILTFNSSSEMIFGYKSEEMIGENISLLYPETFRVLYTDYLKNDERYLESFKNGRDLNAVRKDGKEIPIRVAVGVAEYNSRKVFILGFQDISVSKNTEEVLRQNKLELENSNEEINKARKAALSIMQDANIQRKTAEDALNELKISTEQLKKLSRAIEQSPTTVIIANKEGIIEYVNSNFSKTTGFDIEEIMGKKAAILKSDYHEEEFYIDLWNTIKSGDLWSGEFKSKRKNGTYYWESVSISPIKNKREETTHYVAVKEDIDSRKEMEIELKKSKELAEEATKAKSQFLATMSHEIRTPMNAIIGLSHLALQTHLDQKQLDYLIKIDRSARSLLGIINDILDFSKIEAGKLKIENINFDLEQVLSTVSNLVSQKAQEKELEFAIHIAPEVPLGLVGDPLRVGQVITNFCSNAVKFTEQGEVVITINLEEKFDNKVKLVFCVKDTGIGLTNDQKNNLFMAFQQADSTTTRKYGGTGLGLAISKKLVDLMGGEIWFESQTGKGSSFCFSGVYEVMENQKKKILVPSLDLKGMRVLVCDDNESSRIILTEALEVFTFQVTAVSSGKEALAELEKRSDDPYKLVLMDWKMPEMDGIETSLRIKESKNISVPLILMITAFGNEVIFEKAINAGIDGYLTKPITYSSLFDSIMELFGKMVDKSSLIPINGEKYKKDIEFYKSIRLLLVEDNEINQQIATELFESAGLIVDVAKNGREAVEKVQLSDRSSKYDIIFMDLQMPVMDGYAATREIKKMPAYKDMPIVAMTADAMEGVQEKCFEAGMDAYVAKPIELDEVLGLIIKMLKNKKQQTRENINRKILDIQTEEAIEKIPDLNFFIVKDGLRRVAGNKKMYLKFLNRYRQMLLDFPMEFKILINDNEIESAHRLVHTLKGVSANLGCETIRSATGEIEKYFKDKNEEALESNLVIFKEKSSLVLDDLAKIKLTKTGMESDNTLVT